MSIKKPNELDFSRKKFVGLICGRPGVGKTTLCESAPKPIVFDLENGIVRVEACYRGDVSVVDADVPEDKRYEAFLKDIESPEMKDYDTVVIDSLGKLIELIIPVVIKENPVNGQKDGKTLSLKGYGAIKTKLKEFKNKLLSLNKNLLYIAHTNEFQDGDITKTRLLVPGSTKDDIWDDIDFGGFIEIVGKKRIIHFAPSEKYDAKKTQGIEDMYEIPYLKSTKEGGKSTDNNFFTLLFDNMRTNLLNEQKTAEVEEKIYNKAMELTADIEAISTIDELNTVMAKIMKVQHALTSKKELTSKFTAKVHELGATYDKEAKCYIASRED